MYFYLFLSLVFNIFFIKKLKTLKEEKVNFLLQIEEWKSLTKIPSPFFGSSWEVFYRINNFQDFDSCIDLAYQIQNHRDHLDSVEKFILEFVDSKTNEYYDKKIDELNQLRNQRVNANFKDPDLVRKLIKLNKIESSDRYSLIKQQHFER